MKKVGFKQLEVVGQKLLILPAVVAWTHPFYSLIISLNKSFFFLPSSNCVRNSHELTVLGET